MSIVALARVNFVQPLGDVGDRTNLGMSTAIANEEWHIEADYHQGRVGDVAIYRNIDSHIKGAAPKWRWYCAVPTANIKAYSLASTPQPSALGNGESQTTTSTARAPGTGAGAKS